MSFIGKTKTFLGLNALRNLVSDSMAIDMGSASTIIAVRGRGVVVDEPSVVAVNKATVKLSPSETKRTRCKGVKLATSR